VMHTLLDEGAKSHRVLGQDEALQRLKDDFARFMEISAALGPDEWSGFTAPHKYMGPAPAYIFPVFQLVDYGVHSWDIRQGTGRSRRRPAPEPSGAGRRTLAEAVAPDLGDPLIAELPGGLLSGVGFAFPRHGRADRPTPTPGLSASRRDGRGRGGR